MKQYFKNRRICFLTIIIFSLAACNSPSPAPMDTNTPQPESPTPSNTTIPTETLEPTASAVPTSTSTKKPPLYSESVTITTGDGVDLSGKILGEGEAAVIMLHMVADSNNKRGSKNDWMSLALPTAREGYTVLTLDFRGFGDSAGRPTYSEMWQDVQAAVEFLIERGHDDIVCIGGSLGGSACLWAGTAYDLAGLIIIASPMDMGLPNGITDEDFPKLTMNKLFLVSEFDNGDVAEAMAYMAENSPDPKQSIIYPEISAHGTELLGSKVKEEFKQDILDFLNQIP